MIVVGALVGHAAPRPSHVTSPGGPLSLAGALHLREGPVWAEVDTCNPACAADYTMKHTLPDATCKNMHCYLFHARNHDAVVLRGGAGGLKQLFLSSPQHTQLQRKKVPRASAPLTSRRAVVSSPRWFISEKEHQFFSDGTAVPIDVACVGAIHVHAVCTCPAHRSCRSRARSKRELWSVVR